MKSSSHDRESERVRERVHVGRTMVAFCGSEVWLNFLSSEPGSVVKLAAFQRISACRPAFSGAVVAAIPSCPLPSKVKAL